MRSCGCCNTGYHRKECETGKVNTAPPLAALWAQYRARPVEPRVEYVHYGRRAKRNTPVGAS